MSSNEEKNLLQQITYLSRLIKRHKKIADPVKVDTVQSDAYRLVRKERPSAQASCSFSSYKAPSYVPSIKQQSQYSYSGLREEAQSCSYVQLSEPVSNAYNIVSSLRQTSSINRKPNTILINPNFKKTEKIIPESTNVLNRTQDASQLNYFSQSLIESNANKHVEESVRPKTILVNPNFKGPTGKTSVYINSKVFTILEQGKQQIPKEIDPSLSSFENSNIQNVPSNDYAMKAPIVKKYSFKSNRKLVRQNISPKPSNLQQISTVPSTSVNPLISINNRKLVRMSSKTEKFISALKLNKNPYKKSYNFYKYKKSAVVKRLNMSGLGSRTLARQKRSSKACRLISNSKYKFVRGSKIKSPAAVNKFRLDRRPPGTQSRFKNVKKYSLSYEASSTTPRRRSWQNAILPLRSRASPLSKTYRYRKTSTSSQGPKSSEFSIKGHKFVMDAQGKTLRRLPIGSNSVGIGLPSVVTTLSRIHVAGATYAAKAPNVYIRTNDHTTRTLVSQAKYKSISVLVNKLRKNNQPCIFYRRFGKCIRQEKGTCPCVHDPKQVSICKKFLQGRCEVAGCLLSHDVRPEKMPTCQYFLAGCCVRDPCPYLHVKVNARADICPDFLIGYCASGNRCKKRHVNICPEFDRSGKCSKGKFCPHPHRASKKKSLPQASKAAKVCAAVASPMVLESTRYYQSKRPSASSTDDCPGNVEPAVSHPQSSQKAENQLITPSVPHKKPKIGPLPSYIPI